MRTHSISARMLAPLLTAAISLTLSSGCAAAAQPAHSSHPHAHLAPARFAPATATTAFGLDLMRRLGSGNLVFSPDSIVTALSMAGTGAAGNTAAQMAIAMRLHSPSAFNGVGDLQRQLSAEQSTPTSSDPEAPTLELADALFLQRNLQIGQPFVSGLQQHFGAAPQTVDFEQATGEAVQSIDSWVSEHTHGLIPKILASLPSSTRLVLANAIYLKAAWAQQFKTTATSPGTFHRSTGAVSTPFMHETTGLPYGHGRDYAAVSLPYHSSTLSLLVLLPVGESVGRLLHGLTPNTLNAIVRSMHQHSVRLSLPRFHIALKRELNGPLEALGMTDAFHEGADFSDIGAGKELKIGLVEHAADFKIDETGTLAAAATTVSIEATAIRVEPQPITFDANHPFLFFLRDDRTGALLFAGRVADPSAG
jgi:serpin B